MTHIKRTRFASLDASRIARRVDGLKAAHRRGPAACAAPLQPGQRPLLDPLSVVGLPLLVGAVLPGAVGLDVAPSEVVPPDIELPDDELPEPLLPEPELPEPMLPELPDDEPDVPPPVFHGMWLHAASENASSPTKSTRCCVRFIINSSVIGFTVCVRDDAACHFSKRGDSA